MKKKLGEWANRANRAIRGKWNKTCEVRLFEWITRL